MLKNPMDGAGTAHAVIANNVSNVNTPNFHRSDVSFKDALAAADPQPPGQDELELTTTDARHIDPDASTISTDNFKPDVEVDNSTQMRVDGSNVDVDQEMAKLSANSAYGQTMAQMLTVQFTRLRQAITGSPS